MFLQLVALLLLAGLILIGLGFGAAGVLLVLAGFGAAYARIGWQLWRALRP